MKLDVASATRDQFASYLGREGRAQDAHEEYSIIRSIRDSLDFDRYDEIKHDLLNQGALGSERKYLDLLYWTRSKLRIAIDQGLHEMPPRRLLDLGTGAGHFPFLCKRFGHQVMTLDLGHIELYNKLIEFFEVERVDFEIRPLEPLPRFECRFDLVTGLMVGFNKRSKRELWGEAEWVYFLKDLARNVLESEGSVILKLIKNRDMPGLHYDDPLFVSFIEAHGGTVDGSNGFVHFESLEDFAADAGAGPARGEQREAR